jgi:methionyl-tRNA synthetase
MDRLDFQSALIAIMGFVRTVNGYVTEREPWKLAKDPEQAAALDEVLYSTADSLRAVAVLLNSFMPKSCQLLWESLGAPGALSDATIAAVTHDHLPAGVPVTKGPILFPRLDP